MSMLGNEESVQDGKYRNYVAAMEKVLKNFEYSSEWPDLISALTKLNKVINLHSSKYKVIPRRLLLTKRLSQCLHPSLPSGVHLKALETYDLVFKAIGAEKLKTDLFIYATGLFPLLNYAGLNVKPTLLKIYETYLLPLGEHLIPCLDGFLQGILLGMEESAENQRSIALLESIKFAVSPPVFYTVIWKCTLVVSKLRQASITYLLTGKDSIIGNDISLVKAALSACLTDTNILVQRLSLELLSTRELIPKELDLMKIALRTLLRRDSSLNRRLFLWLSGCDTLLIEAVQSILCDNDEDNYRILVYLFDKQSTGTDTILKSVIVDVIRSMYIHNTPQSTGTIFFSTLNPHYVWTYLFGCVSNQLKCEEFASVQKPGSGTPPLSELCLLISYLISSDFLDSSEELTPFNEKMLEELGTQVTSLPLPNVISILNLSKSFDSASSSLSHFFEIYTTFVSEILFQLDVSTTFAKIVTAKSDDEIFYSSDFPSNIHKSIQSMTVNAPLVLPAVKSNSDSHILDCFKVLNELVVRFIRNLQLEDFSVYIPVCQCLTLAAICDSATASLNAIRTISIILSQTSCQMKEILESTAAIEHIVSFLWDKNDLSTLQTYINYFPYRIERLFMSKTTEVDFDAALSKIKILLACGAPFDSLICKILDGLNETDARVRCRSEIFVKEHLSRVSTIMDPILRILRSQLKLADSVLSSDCRDQRKEEKVKSFEVPDANAVCRIEITDDSPAGKLLDEKGRFKIPIITPAPSDEDDYDEIDEDNYLGLLDGDINHNDTKSGMESSTSSEVEKQFEEKLEKAQPHHNKLFSIHPYTTHMAVYRVTPDLKQMIYGLRLVKRIMETDVQGFLHAVGTTSTSIGGAGDVTYLELLMETVLRALEAFVREGDEDLVTIHIESFRIIEMIIKGFLGNAYKDFLGSILLKLHFPKTILHVVVTLPMLISEEKLTSTEEIMKINYDNIPMVYREVMRVVTSLIEIESELKQYRGTKSKSRNNNSYSPNVPMIRQPLYVDSIRQILSDDKLRPFHLIILESITKLLRFYKTEKVVVDVVKVVIGILGANTQEPDDVYITKILEALTSILHFIVLEETIISEKVQASPSILSNIVSVFVGGTPSPLPHHNNKIRDGSMQIPLLSLLPNLLTSILGIYSAHRQLLNTLLNPIAISFVPQFIQAIGRVDPYSSADLVYGMKVLSFESVAKNVDDFLKQSVGNGVSTNGNSPVIAPEESSTTIVVNLLSFLSHFMDKTNNLSDIQNVVVTLIKDTFALPVQTQLVALQMYYKLVKGSCGKEGSKELQDLGGKLLESICSTTVEKRNRSELTSTQILETLNLYLVSLLDLVWPTNEDKLPISNIITFLMISLKSKYPQQNFILSTGILANFSHYPTLRKYWKKDIFELLLESGFFHFPIECLKDWMTIFDNLFSDKAAFGEFLTRVSVPQTGSLNIFSSKESEYELRGMLLKRLAFVIYSSPRDQYTRSLQDIQQRLAEAIKMPQMVPIIQSQVFLCFRVLLVRLSPQHLNSLWPIILHEILQTLIQMETDLLTQQPTHLYLYLQLCKLLQVALNLSNLSHFQISNIFQMYRWTFVGPKTPTYTPHLTRIASLLQPIEKSNPDFDLTKATKIDSLAQLYPFLINCDEEVSFEILENGLGIDFVE